MISLKSIGNFYIIYYYSRQRAQFNQLRLFIIFMQQPLIDSKKISQIEIAQKHSLANHREHEALSVRSNQPQPLSVHQSTNVLDQIQNMGGNKMVNQILKMVIIFFLFLAYCFFIVGIIFTVISGSAQKQDIVNYLVSPGTIALTFVLILLGITIFLLLRLSVKRINLNKKTRRILNCITDWLQVIFHIIFLIFINPLINQIQQNATLLIAFWVLLAGVVIYIFRNIVKWFYYFCGNGKNNYQMWDKIFYIQPKVIQGHLKLIREIHGTMIQYIKLKEQEKDKRRKTLEYKQVTNQHL